jgi:hypothetical protein
MFGLNFNRPATTVADYWDDDQLWEVTGKPLDLPDDDKPLDMPLDFTMTVRTDLSHEEHALVLTLREFNRAADLSAEAEDVLEKATNEADDARWVKDDARRDFDLALDDVKHDDHRYSYIR